MNQENLLSLRSAVEKAFQEAGVNIYEQAPRLLRLIDENRPHVEASCSPEGLTRFLASATDAEAAKFAMYAKLFTALPTLLAGFVEESVIRTAAAIPPKVGPPNKLTPENKREIVKRVSHHYLAEGLPIGIAQTRVAQQLGLGKRTIQAAWSQRQQLAAQPFQSIGDVWKLFKGNSDEALPGAASNASRTHSARRIPAPRARSSSSANSASLTFVPTDCVRKGGFIEHRQSWGRDWGRTIPVCRSEGLQGAGGGLRG